MSALILLLVACSGTPEKPAEPEKPAVEEPVEEPAAAPVEAGAKVNLNTATDEEFLAVMPDLGKRMLHEFEEYRPYVSITQFRKEMGKYVDEAAIAGYEQHVFVPIDFDACDAATLQQIPGLDEAEAQALIEGRPYGSADAFAKALADKVSEDELATGKSYLK